MATTQPFLVYAVLSSQVHWEAKQRPPRGSSKQEYPSSETVSFCCVTIFANMRLSFLLCPSPIFCNCESLPLPQQPRELEEAHPPRPVDSGEEMASVQDRGVCVCVASSGRSKRNINSYGTRRRHHRRKYRPFGTSRQWCATRRTWPIASTGQRTKCARRSQLFSRMT